MGNYQRTARARQTKTAETSRRVLIVLQEQLMKSPGWASKPTGTETLNTHSWGARTSSPSSERKVLPSAQRTHQVPPPWDQCAGRRTGPASPPGISFIPRPPTPRCAGRGNGRPAPGPGPVSGPTAGAGRKSPGARK